MEKAIAVVRAVRPHQQVKNVLVAVPLLAAHGPFDGSHLGAVLRAFACFVLASAATYLLNDVVDRERDRRHPGKASRPVAAGALAPPTALALALVLGVGAFLLASLSLPPGFVVQLALYLVLATAYSLVLKALLLVDVLALTALYLVRIHAGGEAASIPISPWLTALAVFLFLSLAFVKRYVELGRTFGDPAEVPGESLPGRAWRAVDLDVLRAVGPACGLLAVLVLALYVNGDQVRLLYARPEVLWLACPGLLYWVVRVWLLAHRGAMHDDPLVFATTDPASWLAAAWILATALVAGPVRGVP